MKQKQFHYPLQPNLEPWSFRHGAGWWRLDAYLKRQFVTETININRLADHHIWSTIKTLPATLPEPSSMDRGPRTGVTRTVSHSDLDVC